jgi:hypothetical protein
MTAVRASSDASFPRVTGCRTFRVHPGALI